MEKELKSSTGVLLRADLAGHGQAKPFLAMAKPFLPKWVGWLCPVRSALKRTPVQDFNSFSIMFYNIISTTYQKIGDLFCLVIFLDFRTVCYMTFFKHKGKFVCFSDQNSALIYLWQHEKVNICL